MCFAPQWRALFQHLNVKKWSEHVVFLRFWLGHVLRTTTACTFSTSERQKVVRTVSFYTFDLEMCFAPHFFYISTSKVVRTFGAFSFFTYKFASHHNGVQFFISHLASWLRTRCFSEPTFRPSRATNHWKNTVNRHFPYLFVRLHLVSSDFLHLLSSHFLTSPLWLFPPLLFHLSILSEVWLLNLLRSSIDGFFLV